MEKKKRRKIVSLAVVLVLMLALVGGVTSAYMKANTETPVNNSFTEGTVDCEIAETYDGTEKSSISVENTGTAGVYIRVKLVTYWVNSDGDVTGKSSASIDSSIINTADWLAAGDNVYYYRNVVTVGASTSNLLSSSLTLQEDSDGNRQVVEVVAEAIQTSAAAEAWGVTVSGGAITSAN